MPTSDPRCALMAACSFSMAAGLLSDALSTRNVQSNSTRLCNCDCSASSRTIDLMASFAINCATRADQSSLRVASRFAPESLLFAINSGAACACIDWATGSFCMNFSATAGIFAATGASAGSSNGATAGRSDSGSGFFSGSAAALAGVEPIVAPAAGVGLNASNRSNTIVSAAYSSGARPNSLRPCRQIEYSNCVSSGAMVCASSAVCVASGSVSVSLASSALRIMSGTACSTAMRCNMVVISSRVDAALKPLMRSSSDVSTTVLPSPWANALSSLKT